MEPSFIQGFNPVISLTLALFLFFISILTAVWSYAYLKEIPVIKKVLLIVLRAAALCLLIFLLLNPFSSRELPADESRAVAVYLDNSQSLSISRGEYDGESTYHRLLESLNNRLGEQFELSFYYFDSQVGEENQLTLEGSATNLYQVYEHFREHENRYLASLVVSDGIITQGRNPLFSASNLSKPMVTVPIGDTTTVRDIAISSISVPEKVFTFSSHPITAEITQQGFEGTDITVTLLRDDELLGEEVIRFNAPQSSHEVGFSTEFTEPGLYTFDLSVPLIEEEFIHQNNRRTFSVEAVDDKTEIVSLAFEVHPDVASVRRLIASDQQYELTRSTYLSTGIIAGTDLNELTTTPDLIIIHGLPESSVSLPGWLESTPVPLLFIALPSSFRNPPESGPFPSLNPIPPADEHNLISVLPDLSGPSGLQHPILQFQPTGIQRYPLLVTANTENRLNTLSSTLVQATHLGETLSIPILSVEESGERRIAALHAFNWFRYENNRSEEPRDFFTSLLTNILSWTASSPDHERLIVEPARETFSENESVKMYADLVNELGEPEGGAAIELHIYEHLSEIPIRTFTMTHDQGGRYSTDAGNLPAGIYRVSGRARVNERELGFDQALFSVGESAIEFSNTKRNDPLLESLAEQTDGLFLTDHDINRLSDFLEQRYALETEAGAAIQTDYFYRSYYWFLLVLILLSAEWLLRKNLSLP